MKEELELVVAGAAIGVGVGVCIALIWTAHDSRSAKRAYDLSKKLAEDREKNQDKN